MMEGLGIAAGALMLVMMGAMMLGSHWLGRKSMDHGKKPMETAACPVSGNKIAISSSAVQATVGGKVYYFDNEDHQREFVLDPDKFLRDAKDKGSDRGPQ
ncbi:MAG: hypothetical protein HY549_01450 [Elusimicrobia bacterium]|nr:hypothetical protein [Elusimicrobiota bacterium]